MPKKIHLVIQTPGGLADATTKIAKYLRNTFEVIEAYDPYEAASGGTILCLAADTIIMDEVSNLTPIDPQVVYKGQRISATSYEQAISDFQEEYGKFSPSEIPSPYQQMASQLDLIILKQMKKDVFDTLSVALSLLTSSQKRKTQKDRLKILESVIALGKTTYPHSHIITREEAERQIKLNISTDVDRLELLKIYKKWVSCRLKEEVTNHIIEKIVPQIQNENGKNKKNK